MVAAMPNTSSLRIHLLDMGQTKYGDCLFIQGAGKTILVDAGHPGDWKGKGDYKSIPDQLAGLLATRPPFKVSLLVVTHCHSDHIGCLPKLVADGTVQAEWALVADEYLGFGRSRQHDDFPSWRSQPAELRQVTAGLREENHADLPDDELAQFLADAANLEQNYRDLLSKLEASGTKVIRYLGEKTKDLAKVQRAFAAVGLKILGPTEKQLLTCAEAISKANSNAVQLVGDCLADAPDPVALYRSLASRIGDAADRPGKGAALNDQSIGFSIKVGGSKALLTGDMQFAKPEIDGLDEEVKKLKDAVAEDVPFEFVKIAHHGSYNAIDATVLGMFSKDTEEFAISGGIDDPGHPDPSVLQLLKKTKVHWARTDRNGLISVTLGSDKLVVDISRGKKDDATPNVGDVAGPAPKAPGTPGPEPPLPKKSTKGALVPSSPPTRSATAVATPARPAGSPNEIIEVITKVPHVSTSVRVTIDVAPGRIQGGGAQLRREEPPEGPTPDEPLGGGRKLPKLLFVTSRAGLENNIGRDEATQALKMVTEAGQELFDALPAGLTTAQEALPNVRRELTARPDVQGLVLLGGYDVIPPLVLDVLDNKLRTAIQGKINDADNFIVWADGPYGDADGAGGRLVPVSRIPDGKSPTLVFAALSASRPSGNPAPLERFGVRNYERPFAIGIFKPLPGTQALWASGPVGVSQSIQAQHVQPGNHHYFMLHGSDRDGTRFWGEDNGDYPVAFDIKIVPKSVAGTIFCGCCWGALAGEPKASRFEPGRLEPRTPDNSVALRFLQAGALAFVGCTGTHYSQPSSHTITMAVLCTRPSGDNT
jgi:beta-lactamase superfamily II metal-dependent hydrolase